MRRLLVLSWIHLSIALAVDVLPAQFHSSVRGWSYLRFDTEARNGRFVDTSASGYNTAVLRSDGRIFAQGQNYFLACDVPLLPQGSSFTQVALGWMGYGLGLLTEGTIVGWGSLAGAGALGWPLQAPPLPLGTRYVQLSAGPEHALLLRSDGAIVAWGSNYYGQCTVPALPPGTWVVDLLAAGARSYALLSDGTILAWGDNRHGLCNIPALPAGVYYVGIDSNDDENWDHVVLLRSDGNIVAWGDNSTGQCNVPTLPYGMVYERVATGNYHTVAWRSDGQFVAWGDNYMGQCNVPVVPRGITCHKLECGIHHTVALMSDGGVLAWGHNSFHDSYIPPPEPTRGPGSPLARIVDASSGGAHDGYVLSNGTLHVFGNNQSGQCDVPPLPRGVRYTKVAAGITHTAALRSDGVLVAFGDNSTGMCTVPALPTGVTYTALAVADGHTAALRSDGTAIAFGNNTYGQCIIPALPPLLRYVEIDVQFGRTVLRRSDGAIVYAGTAPWPVPALPAGVEYADLGICSTYDTALRSDGTIETWGIGWYPSSGLWKLVPQLPFGVYYVEVDGAQDFIVLRRSDGLVEIAGENHPTPHPDQIPPLDPGTSYVQVASNLFNMVGRVGPPSTYASFAQGCAGSQQPARLVPRDTPHLAGTMEVNVFDLPQSVAFMLFGWQRTPPFPLAGVGAPGCHLNVSPDAAVFLIGQNGVAKYWLSIPNHPGLVGMHFYNQALVLDPNAGNPLGGVVSNAAEGVIGHW